MVNRHMITWRSRPWEGVSLLGFGMDPKTSKQAPRTLEELIAATAIHYVQSGGAVCAFARMANCEIPCLDTAGRGQTNSVQASRAKKRELMLTRPADYRAQLIDGARAFAKWCKPRGLAPHIRANGTHDDPLGSLAMARAVPSVRGTITRNISMWRRSMHKGASPMSRILISPCHTAARIRQTTVTSTATL